MLVRRWNWITCRLDLVEMTKHAAGLLKPLTGLAILSCVASHDATIPPAIALPPAIVYRGALPEFPQPWGLAPDRISHATLDFIPIA